MSEVNQLYRLNDVLDEDGVKIRVETFIVVKETPCGKWVKSQYAPTWLEFAELKKRKFLKWISNTSSKKHCYANIGDAINSFHRRKLRQVGHLKYKLEQAEVSLAAIESIKLNSVEDFRSVRGGQIPSSGELCWDF